MRESPEVSSTSWPKSISRISGSTCSVSLRTFCTCKYTPMAVATRRNIVCVINHVKKPTVHRSNLLFCCWVTRKRIHNAMMASSCIQSLDQTFDCRFRSLTQLCFHLQMKWRCNIAIQLTLQRDVCHWKLKQFLQLSDCKA